MNEVPTVIRTPDVQNWMVVTFKKPIQWARSDNEIWMFNPPRRYILNSGQLEKLKPHIETISDLKSGRLYRPLVAGTRQNLHGARLLVERFRDRGIGDLLFMTGPLEYLKHLSGASLHTDLYSLTGTASVLAYHPALAFESPIFGPIHYDDLPLYHYHWFVDAVTECDEEVDQLNVYDALYKQIGIDPSTVPLRFKRPSMRLVDRDAQDLDSVYYTIFMQRKIDLRKTQYYVVAPLSHSSLRTAPYALWLQLIRELAKVRPVVVVGKTGVMVPPGDMSFGTFTNEVNQIASNSRVINLMGDTNLRSVAGVISNAVCCVTLDSGLLYVAQALRVPVVSLWGTHAPQSRIGYDQPYMDLAIWTREICGHCPCYAYAGWPSHKCPRGDRQQVCEVLAAVPPDAVIDKIKLVEDGKWSPDAVKVTPPSADAQTGVEIFKG
jgi:hypothetical protein